ncbi:MAG: WD40 repeat domain-containing protein [Epsilonproteobacteria bacterium]|nr:WD40 repeat domain-containing protein [Campylobacterota bacterium]
MELWFKILRLYILCNAFLLLTPHATAKQENRESITFEKRHILKGHKDIVEAMKILRNGLLASVSADATIRIWDMDGACTRKLCNQTEILCIEELADGRIACGSNDGTVNLWDYLEKKCSMLHNLKTVGRYSNALVQLSNGTLAFGTRRSFGVWDIDKDVSLKKVEPETHNAWISSIIEIKATNHIATSSWDRTIKIWDIDAYIPSCLHTLEGHNDCINVIKQLNEHTLVSASDDKTIMTWDINSGKKTETLEGHDDRVYALLVVDNKIISGSRDKTVKIWDAESKHNLATIPCQDKVYSLAFSKDQNYLFIGLGCGDIEVFQLTEHTHE